MVETDRPLKKIKYGAEKYDLRVVHTWAGTQIHS